MIHIGMNDRLFPSNWRPITQDILFAQAHGFTHIQFHGRPNGLGAEALGAALDETGAALRDAHVGAVMEIIVRLDATCRTPEGKRPIEVLEANLPAITALGCTHVHWHPVQSERLDASGLRALERRLYKQLTAGVELSRGHGFRFGFEHNEPATGLFGEPEYCAAALEAVPGVGFVWDLNHTRPDQRDAYLAFAGRMSMLHLADTPLPNVNYHLPIGMGNIDFRFYFHELLARGFDGPGILEIGGLPRSGGYGRDTDEALIESRAKLLHILQKET